MQWNLLGSNFNEQILYLNFFWVSLLSNFHLWIIILFLKWNFSTNKHMISIPQPEYTMNRMSRYRIIFSKFWVHEFVSAIFVIVFLFVLVKWWWDETLQWKASHIIGFWKCNVQLPLHFTNMKFKNHIQCMVCVGVDFIWYCLSSCIPHGILSVIKNPEENRK